MAKATDSKNVYQRMAEAIAEVGGPIAKDGKTDYGERFAYHQIDDVLGAIRKPFLNNGLDLDLTLIRHRLKIIPGVNKQGQPRNEYITVVDIEITVTNIDDPADSIARIMTGYGFDFADKGPGKAVSYALKTWLLPKLFLKGNPDNEAAPPSDNRPTGKPGTKTKATSDSQKTVTKPMLKAIFAIAGTVPEFADQSVFLAFVPALKTKTVDELTREEAVKLKKWLTDIATTNTPSDKWHGSCKVALELVRGGGEIQADPAGDSPEEIEPGF